MKRKLFAVPKSITGQDVKGIREKLNLTQAEFSALVNVSKKTVERWESEEKPITGPITTLIKLLREYPKLQESVLIPEKKLPLRLWYQFREEVCAVIDVDEKERKVSVCNFTNNLILKPFGKNENPTFEQYEEFLESRCFPKSRDKMKLVLADLNLPFYDPLLIIEKTQGRMAEDDCWIRIER